MSNEDASERSMLEPGADVDHYRVLRLLGQGGMGEVYLARDTRLGRRVALKVVRADAVGTGEALERFMFEARATARFSHPHIVTIYGVGEHRGGPYVALEYLEGRTLRRRLGEGRIGLRESLRIGLAIAEAIREAHAHGILHRDLKPENVVICRDGRLRVLDFGLAKVFRDPRGAKPAAGEARTVAEPGAVRAAAAPSLDAGGFESRGGLRGTPAYMAPEQWQERPCTGAADVWALGLMLHEMAAGRHPFEGLGFYPLCAEVTGPDPVPRLGGDVPEAFADLAARCLHKDPAGRPGAEAIVRALEEMVHGQRSPDAEPESPFPGLLPFVEGQAGLFFGREAEVAAFVERLREEPVLAVVGPSGAGKSSFVQAGVVPRLREDRPWVVLRLRPGREPLRTLVARVLGGERAVSTADGPTAAGPAAPSGGTDGGRSRTAGGLREAEQRMPGELRESPARLSLWLAEIAARERSPVLLFVDQFEELYTLSDDAGARRAFLDAVCAAADDPASPVRVVFTLRDDFLGRLAESAAAREVLGRVTVLRPPDAEALEQILRRPVALAGYRYDDEALVPGMVRAVEGEPAALPLLQFAGRTLWERRDRERRLLLRSACEAMGGVEGALAHHADAVLAGLPPEEVQLARTLLLRLVTDRGTRRVVGRAELLDGLDPGAAGVLDRLVEARMAVSRKGRRGAEAAADVELIHESLITAWGRLARWIDESRDEIAFLAEAGQAAELWERRGRPDEEAWEGDALLEALRRAARLPSVPEPVRRFLDAGRARERRRVRRRRLALGGAIAALAAVAVVLALQGRETAQQRDRAEREGAVAEEQRQEAERQRRLAEDGREEAERQTLKAERRGAEALAEGARAALAADGVLEARARVRSSLELADTPIARAVWNRLERTPTQWTYRFSAAPNLALAFSPDGGTVAVTDQSGALHLIDAATGSARVLPVLPLYTSVVAFSPDGTLVALGENDGGVLLADVASGTTRRLGAHAAFVMAVQFSPDGRLLATTSLDSTLRLWDLASGGEPRVLSHGRPLVSALAFGADGRRIAVAEGLTGDAAVVVRDVGSGATIAEIETGGNRIRGLRFGEDGATLASLEDGGTLRVWDIATARPTRSAEIPASEAGRPAWLSPDGASVAVVGRDGRTLRVADAWSDSAPRILEGHTDMVVRVAFDPLGRFVASFGLDRTVRLWRHERAPRRERTGGHSGTVAGVCFSPGARRVASAGMEGTARVWDPVTGRSVGTLGGGEGAAVSLACSPDGASVAVGTTDGVVRLWDVESGTLSRAFVGGMRIPLVLAFAPDGRTLACAGANGRELHLWDVVSGADKAVLSVPEAAGVTDAAFGPGGRLIAAGTGGGPVRIWNASSGAELQALAAVPGFATSVHFGPDGGSLVAGYPDGTIRSWDLAAGTPRAVFEAGAPIDRFDLDGGSGRLAVQFSDGGAEVADTTRGTRVRLGYPGTATAVRLGPDGSVVATGGADWSVRLWDAGTGRPLWRAPLLARDPVELFTHLGWVRLDGTAGAVARQARWREAVLRDALDASQSEDGGLLCIGTFDGALDLWDVAADRRLFHEILPGPGRVIALEDGCLAVTSGGGLRRYDRDGSWKALYDRARAVAVDAGDVLVAGEGEVVVVEGSGSGRSTHPAAPGITALGRAGERLVGGFSNGALEVVWAGDAPGPSPAFEGLPQGAVARIVAGPNETLVAGYDNGVVGIWDLATGIRLDDIRLHGSVEHLLVRGATLYAATDLGDHDVVDLGVLERDYCDLLPEVWAEVPVAWVDGRAVQAPVPADHRCSGR